jgi:hypothetical protein
VITRYRGDTAPDQFTIQRNGVAVNITGCTFKLTVNSVKDPVDATTQLFTVAGSITSAVAGEVEFAPDATQADQSPGRYYYDVQMTDGSGAIRTAQKGVYRFIQDITKS